ncbi:hypothetical protein TNCV_3952931, partial [Trichonephila clavipes]
FPDGLRWSAGLMSAFLINHRAFVSRLMTMFWEASGRLMLEVAACPDWRSI